MDPVSAALPPKSSKNLRCNSDLNFVAEAGKFTCIDESLNETRHEGLEIYFGFNDGRSGQFCVNVFQQIARHSRRLLKKLLIIKIFKFTLKIGIIVVVDNTEFKSKLK